MKKTLFLFLILCSSSLIQAEQLQNISRSTSNIKPLSLTPPIYTSTWETWYGCTVSLTIYQNSPTDFYYFASASCGGTFHSMNGWIRLPHESPSSIEARSHEYSNDFDHEFFVANGGEEDIDEKLDEIFSTLEF